jgi:hypothetical protein
MFEVLKLKRELRSVQRAYAKKYKILLKAKAAKDVMAEHDFLEYVETDSIEKQIDKIIGIRLSHEARSLDVEVPPYSDSDMWTKDEPDGMTWFTSKGRAHARKLIDEEKTRRFEARAKWFRLFLPLIAAGLTGFFGIAGALLGFWLAHKK